MAIVADKADVGSTLDKSLDDGQFVIAPSDTVDLPQPVQNIYVGGAGNITYLRAGDRQSVLITAAPVGARLFVDAVRVMATGTTATFMIGQAFDRGR